jgi:hypothetical protein
LEEKPGLITRLKFIKKVKNGVDAFAASAVFDIDAFESFLPDGINDDMRNEHEALKQMFPKPVKKDLLSGLIYRASRDQKPHDGHRSAF